MICPHCRFNIHGMATHCPSCHGALPRILQSSTSSKRLSPQQRMRVTLGTVMGLLIGSLLAFLVMAATNCITYVEYDPCSATQMKRLILFVNVPLVIGIPGSIAWGMTRTFRRRNLVASI